MLFDVPRHEPMEIGITRGLVAGWTGRDAAAVERHIEELAEIGVSRPSSIPLYYRVAASLFAQAEKIEVVGDRTSGEAEPVVLDDGERLWLTLGSDHTDRALEAHSVALSKQVCAKPLARTAWPLDGIEDRLDALQLRSWIREGQDNDWVVYQDGTLACILPLHELIRDAPRATGRRLGHGTAMMCGTLPVVAGGVRPASDMRLELRDPRHDSVITLEYRVEALELVS